MLIFSVEGYGKKNSTQPESASILSSKQLHDLSKFDGKSSKILKQLYLSDDKGAAAISSALAKLNEKDKELNDNYKVLVNKAKASKVKAKISSKTAKANTSNNSTIKSSTTNTAASSKEQLEQELQVIAAQKMHLVNALTKTNSSDMVAQLIAAADSANPNALLHKTVFSKLLDIGPNETAKNYAIQIINDPESGGFQVYNALLYFAYHNEPNILDKVREYTNPDYHPYIRDMAAFVLGRWGNSSDTSIILTAIQKSVADKMGSHSLRYSVFGLASLVSPEKVEELLQGLNIKNDIVQTAILHAKLEEAKSDQEFSQLFKNNQGKANELTLLVVADYVVRNGPTVLIELELIEEHDGNLYSPVSQSLYRMGYSLVGTAASPNLEPVN